MYRDIPQYEHTHLERYMCQHYEDIHSDIQQYEDSKGEAPSGS